MFCPTKVESALWFEFACIPCADLFQNLGEGRRVNFDKLLATAISSRLRTEVGFVQTWSLVRSLANC